MKSKCLLIDPLQCTPYYNSCLLDALVKKGQKMVYVTTVFPHAESPIPLGVEVRYCFFYLVRMLGRIASSHHFLRRVLRVIEYPINLLALIIYILLNRIKLVHYMWAMLPTVDLFVIRFLMFIGCRVVYTAHDPFPHEFRISHRKKYTRIYHHVDYIIALTNFTRNEIINHAGVSASKISVIPHGDFDYVLAQYPCNEALVKKVRRLAEGRSVISFLGMIRPYKGLKYFIEAFELIKHLKIDTFFLVAGSPRFADKKELEELLSQKCDSKDCYIDLRFLTISDLKAYLSVTDVLVQPYIVGASQSGNTVMAYSAGIPVVCTDVGGMAEMVEEGQSGYVVPSKDSQAIADAVVKCLERDNYIRMSKNARRLAVEKYNWCDIAAQTIKVYHQFIRD